MVNVSHLQERKQSSSCHVSFTLGILMPPRNIRTKVHVPLKQPAIESKHFWYTYKNYLLKQRQFSTCTSLSLCFTTCKNTPFLQTNLWYYHKHFLQSYNNKKTPPNVDSRANNWFVGIRLLKFLNRKKIRFTSFTFQNYNLAWKHPEQMTAM